jgi:hypothetical protein
MSNITQTPSGQTNIIADQNADFVMSILYKNSAGEPVNLTGCTAGMMLRASYEDGVALSLTSSSGIVLGGTAGTIQVTVTAAQNSNLIGAKAYVYDLVLTSVSAKTRIIYGTYYVQPGVTR